MNSVCFFFKPGRFHFWNKLRNYIVGKHIYEHEYVLRFSSYSMFFCDLDCFMALILSAFLHIACVFLEMPSFAELPKYYDVCFSETHEPSQVRSTV